MIRFVLIVAYLTAAVLGSRPCCCATAAAAPPVVAKPTAEHTCPHCKTAEKQTEREAPPADHGDRDCPCPKAKAVPTPHTLPPTADDTRSPLDTADHVVGLLLDSVVIDRAIRVSAGSLAPPPDRAHQLLKLCHRLRC